MGGDVWCADAPEPFGWYTLLPAEREAVVDVHRFAGHRCGESLVPPASGPANRVKPVTILCSKIQRQDRGAASTGDAGKSCVVVASEVKPLSNQTTKAT